MNRKTILQIILAVAIVAIIVRTFFIDSFVVKGDSMAPTILNGDYVFIDKISSRFKDYKRGDILVLKPRSGSGLPAQAGLIIKRLIGLPNERIEIKDNLVRVKESRQEEGRVIPETYLAVPATLAIGISSIKLDPKEYFVLGDNRTSTIDSRELGPIDEWDIKGKVIFILSHKSFSIKIF